jgi:hypothetical protein
VALRVAYPSGRSHDHPTGDCHAYSGFSFSLATAGWSTRVDRHLDPDSAAQRDSFHKLHGHQDTNAHGDLHVAANSQPHCADLADRYADAKPDLYQDSDTFTATRTPSSYGDTGAAIRMKLAF